MTEYSKSDTRDAYYGPSESDGPSTDSVPSDRLTHTITKLYRRFFEPLVDGLIKAHGLGPPDPQDVAHQAFEKLIARGNLDEIRDKEAYLWMVLSV